MAVVFAGMRLFVLAALLLAVCGCNNLIDKKNKEGICVHSRKLITYSDANCQSATQTSAPEEFCEQTKEKDCTEILPVCPSSAPYQTYSDLVSHTDDKKCEDSGYSLTCPSNSNHKVANLQFCPQ